MDTMNNYYTPPTPEPKKKKKTGLICLVVALCVVVLIVIGAGAIFLINRTGTKNVDYVVDGAIYARYDQDGDAYIPLMDGTVIELGDHIYDAGITPDRKRVVVLTDDGELYYTDEKQKNKTEIADIEEELSEASLYSVYSEGIFYHKDGELYRYLFENDENFKLGNVNSFMVSDENFNIAYCVDQSVYLLLGSSDEKEKIGKGTGRVTSVSNDGKQIYWIDNSNSGKSVMYAYLDGETEEVISVKYDTEEAPYFWVSSNRQQAYQIVTTGASEYIYIVTNKGKTIRADVHGGTFGYFSWFYTKSGDLSLDTSSDFKGMYAVVRDEDSDKYSFCLYYIDEDGNSEKLLSDIAYSSITYKTAFVENGYFYYLDSNGDFRVSKLSSDSMDKGEKIAKDIQLISHLDGTDYFYFTKAEDSDSEERELYVYKNGSDPILISEDAYSYGISPTIDGKTVYYYEDGDVNIADTYTDVGTLCKYTVGDSRRQKIETDVIINTISSAKRNYDFRRRYNYTIKIDDSFIFEKLVSYNEKSNEEVDFYYDYYFYDGKKAVKIVDDFVTTEQKRQ